MTPFNLLALIHPRSMAPSPPLECIALERPFEVGIEMLSCLQTRPPIDCRSSCSSRPYQGLDELKFLEHQACLSIRANPLLVDGPSRRHLSRATLLTALQLKDSDRSISESQSPCPVPSYLVYYCHKTPNQLLLFPLKPHLNLSAKPGLRKLLLTSPTCPANPLPFLDTPALPTFASSGNGQLFTPHHYPLIFAPNPAPCIMTPQPQYHHPLSISAQIIPYSNSIRT